MTENTDDADELLVLSEHLASINAGKKVSFLAFPCYVMELVEVYKMCTKCI
jgi:hypothetical protein